MQTQNQPNPNGGNVNFQQNANAELTAPQTETNEYLGGNSGRLAPATCSAAACSENRQYNKVIGVNESSDGSWKLIMKDGEDVMNLNPVEAKLISAAVQSQYN